VCVCSSRSPQPDEHIGSNASRIPAVLLDPAQNRGVRQRDASVRHQDHQVAQAQLETRVPADTQDDDLSVEMPSLEQRFDRAEGLHSAIIRDRTYLHQNPAIYPQRKTFGRFAQHAVLYCKEVIAKPLRLHFGRIEDELRDVQRHFPAINAVLNSRRDDFTDAVRLNMVAAFEFLDALVAGGLDLFSAEGVEALLQLNHLVLLGRGYNPLEFRKHISVTRRQFFDNFRTYIKPIRRWYRRHEAENPYKVASQVYVGVLSQPQLFQEGNHRTGSLIASGILLQNGCPPFVLTRQNAVAYFNPSTEIKFTDKRTINGKLRMPKYQRDFRKFLERNINPAYVRQSWLTADPR
jgi:hypothetical protein